MVTPELAGGHAPAPSAPRHPPIIELAIASMALIIAGVIYLAAYMPRTAPLAPAVGLLIAAVLPLLANVLLLTRLRQFAWDRFLVVGEWALLAYVVIAGMLEYVFVLDGMRGSLLVVMTLMLVVFTINIPVLLAFAVARYKTVDLQR